MTPEEICADVPADIQPQAITLARAVLALQDKLEHEIPNFAGYPMAQQVKTTAGGKAWKSNPAVAEFRALVRDYSATLKDLNTILNADGDNAVQAPSSLDALRAKFKVVG